MPLKRTGCSGDKSEHGSPQLPKEKSRWKIEGIDFTESLIADSALEIKVKEESWRNSHHCALGVTLIYFSEGFSHHPSSGDERQQDLDYGAQFRSLHLTNTGASGRFFHHSEPPCPLLSHVRHRRTPPGLDMKIQQDGEKLASRRV